MMYRQFPVFLLIQHFIARIGFQPSIISFFVILLIMMSPQALAGNSDDARYKGNISFDTFKLQNINTGIYMVNGQLKYELSGYLDDGLKNGVVLESKITFYLIKPRRFWLDGRRAWATINTTLNYHALSQHYQVVKSDTQEHWNFKSLRSALQKLGEIQGYRLPSLEEPVDQHNDYSVEVFATLKPSGLSFPMRIESFFIDKYALKTTGLAWPLP